MNILKYYLVDVLGLNLVKIKPSHSKEVFKGVLLSQSKKPSIALVYKGPLDKEALELFEKIQKSTKLHLHSHLNSHSSFSSVISHCESHGIRKGVVFGLLKKIPLNWHGFSCLNQLTQLDQKTVDEKRKLWDLIKKII